MRLKKFNSLCRASMLFLLLSLFANGATLHAQEFKPEMAIGARGGATLSFMILRPSVNQSFNLGPNAGFVFRYISQKYCGIQVELNYIQKGWGETLTNGHKYSRVLNYIEIPAMTHITFGQRMARGFINLGPNISYLLNDKTNGYRWQESGQIQLTEPIKNHFDFGICAGIGFELNSKAGIYQLEARYNYGLGNLFSSSSGSPLSQSSNQNISLNLGILFHVK